MKSPWHALIWLIAAGFLWGVLHLFGLQFTEGDVYPEYSSLRSDPVGVKLLFDSLARIPGLTLSRNYLPLDGMSAAGTTLILLGLQPAALAENAAVLQKIAGAGNRVVAAMGGQSDAKPEALEKSWGVRLDTDSNRRVAHRLWFAGPAGWRVLERVGVKILAMEREFGKGTVVLQVESDDFTNQAMIVANRLEQVTGALGGNPALIFDENHLGIAESGSVVSLARRFRLTGFAFGLAICTALWIWRASSAFPPPRPAQDRRNLTGRTSQSGLLTLLRRNLAPRELLPVCWEQWHIANRHTITQEKLERAASLAHRAPEGPLEAARAIHEIIHSKGPL